MEYRVGFPIGAIIASTLMGQKLACVCGNVCPFIQHVCGIIADVETERGPSGLEVMIHKFFHSNSSDALLVQYRKRN